MEHFAVVQSLIRSGLEGDKKTFEKQVGRLKTRLDKAGDAKAVATIERLLESSKSIGEMKPSEVSVSRMQIFGEDLSRQTQTPLDKETGASLCEVIFPDAFETTDYPIYDEVVQNVVDGFLIEWTRPDELAQLGVEPTRSILIFGPPGSGKTLSARYIAHKLGLPVVVGRIDGLISSFLGTTARNIANLFTFANRFKCVLLLDEFDAIAKLRDDPQEVGEIKRVVNTLLQNLDSRKPFGLTIAITNHDRLLDPAVWRRFQTQIHLGDPSEGARDRLVRRFLEPITISDSLMALISYCLADRSGAEIERLCESSKRQIAIKGQEPIDQNVMQAFIDIATRLPDDPVNDESMIRILATDTDRFIGLVSNNKKIGVSQSELARIFDRDQPSISRLRKAYQQSSGVTANG